MCTRVYALEWPVEVNNMSTRSDAPTMNATYEPAPGEQRSKRFDLRVTPSEAAFIRQAAASRRQSVTEFLTTAAIEAATRAIDEDRRIVLINEVIDRLAQEMEREDELVPALANLIKRPRRFKLPD